jgi:DNA ligase (NAD+)
MTLNEELYLKAKNAYYSGNTIMTDAEFDRLEAQLKAEKSTIVEIVGETLDNEVTHPSKMLSLDKLHIDDLDKISMHSLFGQAFLAWFTKTCKTNNIPLSTWMYIEPKYDGSSCNLVYHYGKLHKAATRGNGTEGTDITNKMSLIVPKTISDKSAIVEIRGEVNIKTDTFSKKYADKFKNARNFVAGILGRDENFETIVPDFDFIAYEFRSHGNNDYNHVLSTTENLRLDGFITPDVYKVQVKDMETAIKTMHEFRLNKSEYGLDGMVVKLPEQYRIQVGETGHHPKWALAIKFPPTEAVTYIKDIVWKVGQTGEFTPVAILDPVELDGSTVSRVTLSNYGKLISKGLFPGAKIAIVKSGDIIPFVKTVIKPQFANLGNYIPTKCSTPQCKIEVQGIHLCCTNPNCESRMLSKLAGGLRILGIENIGSATVEKIFNAGIKNILDVFNPTKFNKANLIKSGQFKEGRSLDIILESVKKHLPFTYTRIIDSLMFDNTGSTISIQIAKIFEGTTPNWDNMSKAAYEPFLNPNSFEYQKVIEFVKLINSIGEKIETEKKVDISNLIPVVLTGSPKEFGYKTKDEFMKANPKFVEVDNLKGAKYLITNDLNSTSSKMKTATKLNVEIITYDELKNK